jgi:hypothetical protein
MNPIPHKFGFPGNESGSNEIEKYGIFSKINPDL